jgi:hypothetical protein
MQGFLCNFLARWPHGEFLYGGVFGVKNFFLAKLLVTIPSYMYYLDGYFGVGEGHPEFLLRALTRASQNSV